MTDRKANLLITMVFDKDLDIRKQIDTELALKKEITKDLQHLITGREIKHFIIADDEVINKKLTEERKVGKWIKEEDTLEWDGHSYQCSICGRSIHLDTEVEDLEDYPYCHCGAEMEGSENENNIN